MYIYEYVHLTDRVWVSGFIVRGTRTHIQLYIQIQV